jgi:hypothetical protein
MEVHGQIQNRSSPHSQRHVDTARVRDLDEQLATRLEKRTYAAERPDGISHVLERVNERRGRETLSGVSRKVGV